MDIQQRRTKRAAAEKGPTTHAKSVQTEEFGPITVKIFSQLYLANFQYTSGR
jgi:hypothetical protein